MVLWADHSSSVCGGSLFWLYDSRQKTGCRAGRPCCYLWEQKRAIQNRHSQSYAGFVRLWREREAPRRRWNICDRDQRSYSDRSAVTGLHLAALIEGIRPPRMVSSVESSTRITAASSGSTAVI